LLSGVSISSTSEEVQRKELAIILQVKVDEFPLVQLPKKFKVCYGFDRGISLLVSISSTSEEVQSD